MAGQQLDHASDAYDQIAHDLPNETRLGSALITMVEPHPGHERAYNRWYEDDHFYAGVMVGPWTFAGRRWVATRDLQMLRYPEDSPIARPVTAGCYLSLFWFTAGHHDDAVRWGLLTQRDGLRPFPSRGFDERTHIFTAFSRFEFGRVRDEGPMRPEHALDHPFRGLVVEVVEPAPGAERPVLMRWLQEEFIPTQLAGSPVAQCLAFSPDPPTELAGEITRRIVAESGVAPSQPSDDQHRQLLTLLWFLQVDPREWWSVFGRHGTIIESSGAGRLLFAGPFIPTVPGTELYVDELRGP